MDTHDDRTRADAEPRVAPLGDLGDFQIADGYPDPRGWRVRTSDGVDIGNVHDLIVDTGSMRTRYLDVRLDPDKLPRIEGMRHEEHDVLVPISAAQISRDDKVVTLPSFTAAQMATMPAFTHGRVTREYEESVHAMMPPRSATTSEMAASAAAGAGAMQADARAAETRAETRAADARAEEARTKAERKAEERAAEERPRTLTEDRPVHHEPVRAADVAQTTTTTGETEVRIPFGDQEIVIRKRATEPPPREHGTDTLPP